MLRGWYGCWLHRRRSDTIWILRRCIDGQWQKLSFVHRSVASSIILFSINDDECWFWLSIKDSCETAVCGPHKRCVIRAGQRKCVCAYTCGSTKQTKRHHKIRPNENKLTEKIIKSDRSGAEMIANIDDRNKSGKMIAIIDSSSSGCGRKQLFQFGENSNCTERKQSDHGIRGEKAGKHIFTSNAGNTTERTRPSLEERIRSRFYGYDMPYPPIDFDVIASGLFTFAKFTHTFVCFFFKYL